MIRHPPYSPPLYSSAASDVYKRQHIETVFPVALACFQNTASLIPALFGQVLILLSRKALDRLYLILPYNLGIYHLYGIGSLQIFLQRFSFDQPFTSIPEHEGTAFLVGQIPELVDADAEVGRGLLQGQVGLLPVSYTHLRAHETGRNLVCRLLLEKKKTKVYSKESRTPNNAMKPRR